MNRENNNNFWQAAKRGLLGKCPNCGMGKLLYSYLKPVENCKSCGEGFGHIRADDGPAWLTILIVGHILAPLLLTYLPDLTWPDWAITLAIMFATLVLIFLILPRSKGFFIAMIWRSECLDSKN